MASDAGGSSHQLRLERMFAAPVSLVFAAWTEPERLARWFGPRGVEVAVLELEARPGGAIHFCHRFAGGDEVRAKGSFLEVVAPTRLVFALRFVDAGGRPSRHPGFPDWPIDAELTTTVTLADRAGKTLLELQQVLRAGAAATDSVLRERAQARAGWDEGLDRLAELVEGGVR